MSGGQTFVKVNGAWDSLGIATTSDIFLKVDGFWRSVVSPFVPGPMFIKINGVWESWLDPVILNLNGRR